jgi:serine/threonine protein kinase
MQEQSIFIEALERQDPAERATFLDQVCAGDSALRQRIERLLARHQQAGSFLESPAAPRLSPDDELSSEGPGTRIGPYKLLQQIGEGGMGTVYMAEQEEPVRRKVALKIIKPGMDSAQVIARFEAERQALALMDSQNIAKVFDAGTTATGRPYFVMELVHGVPITQFCDDNQLTPRQRLELFVPVCQAIQHAHQKGIIHRDIKPSNVLVTLHDDKPVPKVIDFGVAKAIEQRLTEKTLFTQFGVLIGTFEYMSPEQAEMNAWGVDTRSDIYSLGVLLYELLTGTTPLQRERLREAALDELVRWIKEEEPPRPSVRLSSSNILPKIAAARKTEPAKLSKLVRGEIDWIVMKALEKDRNRRYDTISSFAADVERYLHDEPVQACPPSAVYRFRKFARRNQAALTTVAAIAFAVVLAVVGLATSTVLIQLEQQATANALQAETQARADFQQALKRERQSSYYQRIALAEREWWANNLGRVEQLLEECPADLRGWEWHYLRRQRHKTVLPLHHDTMVLCVAYSPTGQCLASASQDGVIKVWDAQTGQPLWSFPAGQKMVFSLAFSPDGQRLASAGQDGSMRIWDVQARKQLRDWPAHTSPVSCVAFSPDGTRLASTCSSKHMVEDPVAGQAKVWDPAAPFRSSTAPLGGVVDHFPMGNPIGTITRPRHRRCWPTRITPPVPVTSSISNRLAMAPGSPDRRRSDLLEIEWLSADPFYRRDLSAEPHPHRGHSPRHQ